MQNANKVETSSSRRIIHLLTKVKNRVAVSNVLRLAERTVTHNDDQLSNQNGRVCMQQMIERKEKRGGWMKMSGTSGSKEWRRDMVVRLMRDDEW